MTLKRLFTRAHANTLNYCSVIKLDREARERLEGHCRASKQCAPLETLGDVKQGRG